MIESKNKYFCLPVERPDINVHVPLLGLCEGNSLDVSQEGFHQTDLPLHLHVYNQVSCTVAQRVFFLSGEYGKTVIKFTHTKKTLIKWV